MKDENKIPLKLLQDRLQRQMNYRHPDEAFRTLLYCWIRHPKYFSPKNYTISQRELETGYKWLKKQEVLSLESYIGNCKLL